VEPTASSSAASRTRASKMNNYEKDASADSLKHQPSAVSENVILKKEGLSRKLMLCSVRRIPLRPSNAP
jgi:hypothetical protein